MTDRLSVALADRYRIERELGAGGMATVYLAEDLKHKRRVALKVLKPELAAVLGAERFVQEITTTAALQHPHILPLFDSGTADGFLFYVMPFIDGETLRDKLNRETQLGIEEAIRITTDVADALDYAHHQGVIHRDIKPENILLANGRPMVADFGIALAVSAAAGGRMTETGLSLGTPHYMSPEQATAEKEISARSDVYSLASVLYEMLTGNPPHTGASAQQIIMKIVTEEAAPVTQVRKAVPPNVAAAVAKSLEKLPADRFESAQAFATALSDAGFRTQATAGTASPMARAQSRIGWIAATAVLTIVAAIGWWPKHAPAPAVTRFVLPNDPPVMQATVRSVASNIAISPDGRILVWRGPGATAGAVQLYRRRLESLTAEPMPGTEGAEAPFFSPDGRSVGFFTPTALRRIPVDGGQALTIVDGIVTDFAEGFWADDGFIYLKYPEKESAPGRLVGRGLGRVEASGGQIELLERDQRMERGEVSGHVVLPGGRWLVYSDCAAFTCSQTPNSTPRIVARDLRSGQTVPMLENATRPIVLASGHLLFLRNGTLFAVPFDGTPRAITDRPVAIPGIAASTGQDLHVAISRNGTMVYLPGVELRSTQLVAVDRQGGERPLTARPDAYTYPRVDPTGRRIAVTVTSDAGQQVWIYEMGSATLSQFTTDGWNERATWAPDGRELAFSSLRNGQWSVYRRQANAGGPAEALNTRTPSNLRVTPFWAPGGTWVLTDQVVDSGSTDDIIAIATSGDSIRTLVATPNRETTPAVSPDGRWLAYVSDESGSREVYLTPFMSTGGRWQISNAGGDMPLWISPNQVVYLADRALMLAELDFPDGVRVVSRKRLFPLDRYNMDGNAWPYDVMPGGKEFVFVLRGDHETAPVVVLNWFETLRAAFAERP